MTDKLKEDGIALVQLAKDLGYNRKDAERLKFEKWHLHKTEDSYERSLKERDKIKIGRTIPLRILGYYNITQWNSLSEDIRRQKLWEIGFDCADYPVIYDVGCTSVGGKRECGVMIHGQERTDTAWVKLVINGKKVCSWEAELEAAKDPTLKRELRQLSLGGGA